MEKKLLNWLDFEKVDNLLEGFNKSTGFVTAILDLEGNVLSKSGWRQICTDFHRINPETSQRCRTSDTVLANKMAEGEKFHFYKCLNGLVDVSVPLVIRGIHVANLFSGQFFVDKPDYSFFEKQAEKYGFNKKVYLGAVKKVPVVSTEKVKTAMDFLVGMTQTISDLTLNKIELAELNTSLKKSEAIFKTVFEAANVGKSITLPSGEINVNQAFCNMLGYAKEELLNKKWQDLTPKDEIQKIKIILDDMLLGKIDSARFEKRYIHKNGSFIWTDVSVILVHEDTNKPMHFITTIIDISDQKRTEKLLRESEERYRNLVNSAPVGIAVHAEGKIVFANQAGLRIIGAESFEQVIGKNSIEIIHSENQEQSLLRVQRMLNGEEGLYPTEDKYVRLDKKVIDVEVMATPLSYNKNQAVQVIFTDITEKKHMQDALQQMNTMLEKRVKERTNELELANHELESFSYSVSHDLRAPLRHINGYVDLLTNRFQNDLPEKAQHYLNTIAGASKQMGTLIDDLLQFSRTARQEVKKIQTDMFATVKEVLNKFNSDTQNRNIEWNIEALPEVMCDYAMIKQVWFNLIDNAVKYTRKNPVTKIYIGYKEENKNFVFYISDNGVGFDMKYAGKMFGVFQRLHSSAEFEGTGIGLANVQRIIHKHNGKIWAEAQPEKGASFSFSLPKN